MDDGAGQTTGGHRARLHSGHHDSALAADLSMRLIFKDLKPNLLIASSTLATIRTCKPLGMNPCERVETGEAISSSPADA